MEHIDVLLATPGNAMDASYVSSLLATVEVLKDRGLSYKWLNGYSSNVHHAREITLSGTRNNNLNESRPLEGTVTYDKLMMIDSDISWTPSDALALIESDKEFITGGYKLSDETIAAFMIETGQPVSLEDMDNNEHIPLYACGLGFSCISSGVLEAMGRPWFRQRNVNVQNTIIPVMGEDVSFCIGALESGFSIWLDTSVRVDHIKTKKLGWGDGDTNW